VWVLENVPNLFLKSQSPDDFLLLMRIFQLEYFVDAYFSGLSVIIPAAIGHSVYGDAKERKFIAKFVCAILTGIVQPAESVEKR